MYGVESTKYVFFLRAHVVEPALGAQKVVRIVGFCVYPRP